MAFAVVTEPIGDLIEARLGEVVPIDGSSSVVPPGGVGLWTLGEQTLAWAIPGISGPRWRRLRISVRFADGCR